ncbi:hypothetical protein NC651_021072 [Populus alba x Populus x berolinensis]|nr:hypothetical protein NC651_021072 [Populus alba x Populus x berolinensis]
MSRLLESSCPLLTFHSLSPHSPCSHENPIKATFAAINITSMDCKDMEENGTNTRRSLRFEDYNNRRVFLRSYPLHFGAEDEKNNEGKVSSTNKDTEKKTIRRMFSAVIHWGEGKVLILRKFKDKLQVTKTRSLRFEDNNNRRVFLRSYPLPFGAEDEKTNEEKVSATNKDTEKKPIRGMFLAVIHWGEGKVLILRKFKDKLQMKRKLEKKENPHINMVQ